MAKKQAKKPVGGQQSSFLDMTPEPPVEVAKPTVKMDIPKQETLFPAAITTEPIAEFKPIAMPSFLSEPVKKQRIIIRLKAQQECPVCGGKTHTTPGSTIECDDKRCGWWQGLFEYGRTAQ